MSALPRLPLQKRADVYDDAVQTITNAVNTRRDELNRTSGGEWAIRGIGAGVGGLLGYYLSGKLHEKPAKVTRLLYALGGAGLGGVTADALITDSQRGRMRFNSVFDGDDAVQKAAQNIENNYRGIRPGWQSSDYVQTGAPLGGAVIGGTLAIPATVKGNLAKKWRAGAGAWASTKTKNSLARLAVKHPKLAGKLGWLSYPAYFAAAAPAFIAGGATPLAVGTGAGYAVGWGAAKGAEACEGARETRPDLGQIVAALLAKK